MVPGLDYLFIGLYFVEVAVLKTNLLDDKIKCAKIIKYATETPMKKTHCWLTRILLEIFFSQVSSLQKSNLIKCCREKPFSPKNIFLVIFLRITADYSRCEITNLTRQVISIFAITFITIAIRLKPVIRGL